MAFHPDARQLASTGMDGTLRVWDTETGRSSVILQAPSGVESLSVVYRPGGQEIAAAFTDGTIRILDVTRGRERLRLDCHS